MEGGGRTPGNKRKSNREELQVDQVRKEYAVTWQAVAEVVEACNGALEELEKCQVELVELEKTTIEFNNQDYVKNVQNEVRQILINTVQTRDRWSKVTLQAKEGEEDQQKPQ